MAEMILQHRGQLDGGGYPRALKGDEIYSSGREYLPWLIRSGIWPVTDTEYGVRPEKAAAREIREGEGTRCDGKVVDATVGLIEAGEVQLDG